MVMAKGKETYLITGDLAYNIVACFVEFMNETDPFYTKNAALIATTFYSLIYELDGMEGLTELHDLVRGLLDKEGHEDTVQ
jgi:hypothetical protein